MSAILSAEAPATTAFDPSLAPARTAERGFKLGKYREIIIAVAFFLLFDLGVLVLNFYTSFQIAEDAVGINLAGRQRMLSQRTAKALFSVETARLAGAPVNAELDELRAAVRLFDASLKGFQGGATVPGGDGKPVFLRKADSPRAVEVLGKAQTLWSRYLELLEPVLTGTASDEQIRAALAYARANNVPLLGLMNELTTALEAVASDRANTLRLVQTGGIVLALLNFVFILLKFLRRLQSSDAAIEEANEENREILSSVREGLFLLTPDLHLGLQLSRSADELFGKRLRPGEDFLGLLQGLVSPGVLSEARDYIGLLFQPHVKESLVQGINPLTEVEAAVTNRLGQTNRRYLSFHFNRAQEGGVVRHLLVTVQDITARIELERRLQAERQRSQREFAMLLKAADTDPVQLRGFIDRAEANLLEVNDLLRSTSSTQDEAVVLKVIDGAFRRIHAIKGDAASLGLETLAALAHQFESELQRLRQSGSIQGEQLLALPMPLEDLLEKVAALKAITGRAGASSGSDTGHGPRGATADAVRRLVDKVANDCGKRVHLSLALDGLDVLPEEVRWRLHEVAIQLARNAVVHGIEAPASRQASSKPSEGRVSLVLERGEGDEWTLTAHDDGAGLNPARVRQRLVDLGWYNPDQVAEFDDRQVLGQLFKPGFSTAHEAGEHAGRGVGLDLVQEHANALGARVILRSTPGRFTELRVRCPA